jgi:transposase
MRPSGTPEALEARRCIAARLFAQGKSLAEVAALVGSSLSSASRWKQAWRHGGVRTLQPKPHPGPEPKLQPPQRRQLLAALKLGTRHWGYAPSGWTGPLVRDLIRRLFAVEYHPDYVGTLLHQMGWSAQKPERRARERDERAIARWRRDDWPRLKKEPRTSS